MVLVVEKWSHHREPTLTARLAQADAFIQLRLLDRAWSRLQALVEGPAPPLEALRSATELMLLRGWRSEAEEIASRGFAQSPADVVLRHLLDSDVAADGRTVDDEDSIEGLILTAEDHMAHGTWVKARALLERARRTQHPRRIRRVEELLWAMRGDFDTDATLGILVDRLGPAQSDDDPEHTVSFDPDEVTQPEKDDPDDFRLLFRNLGPPEIGPPVADEVTSVMHMASPNKLQETLGDDEDDPLDRTDPGHSDTEIMRVVHKGERMRLAKGESAHHATTIDEDFSLAEFRRELGVEPPPGPEADYAAGANSEDDNIIIVTRRDKTTRSESSHPSLQLEADHEAEARDLHGEPEGPWVDPNEDPWGVDDEEITEIGGPRPNDDLDLLDDGPAWPWWMAAMSILLASGVVAFAALSLLAALEKGW